MRTKSLLFIGATAMTLMAGACSNSGSTSATSTAFTSSTTSEIPTAATTPATTSTVAAPPTIATVVAETSTVAPATTSAGAVDPNAPELVEPGDIPDNQVFVAFTSPDALYSVRVPEGWARTEQNGAVTFTDKYNSVTIESAPASSAPTVDSVKSTGLTDVSSDPTFMLVDVTTIARKAGDGVLATFEIGSAPNEVTGKKALLAVERYVFFHNGTQVTLTLSGAKGADNVDPWKIVSDSLRWM